MTLAPTGPVSLTHTVVAADSAAAWGSGTVAVLATPRLLALAEAATLRVLDGRLPPEQTTVGTRVELDHLAAVPVGGQVTVTAELVEVQGSRLRFAVHAHDAAGRAVARGIILRAVVGVAAFQARARAGGPQSPAASGALDDLDPSASR